MIPPNAELTVAGGMLHLATPAEPRGLRLPVNVLFSSLARDQGERAIAVVLSGMGSDGTLGLQAVRAVGGLTVAQQPESAQFDSMPKSAIAAGCADIVAPPAELPRRILDYAAQVQRAPESVAAPTASVQTLLEAPLDPLRPVFDLLRRGGARRQAAGRSRWRRHLAGLNRW